MPKPHVKPTKEELEAGINKALEEAKELEQVPTPEPTPTPEPEKETIDETVPTKEETPKPPPLPTPEPDKEDVDYKKKFIESTREGQVLHSKTKKMSEAVDKANEVPEPTPEEMAKEYPDWEMMDEVTKKLAKDSVRNERRFAIIAEAHKESKDVEAWYDKVDNFVSDPKTFIDNPSLEGKESEFKIFATKPTRRGVDFNDLVASFLWDISKNVKPSKGKMFETGSGGPNDRPQPKSDKISMDEARMLRKNDYPKYVEYLKAGKIDTSI